MEIQKIRSYRFEVSVLVPEFAVLGFVAETLILKNYKILDLIGQTGISLQMELSNVLHFWKRWREATGTGSPNFQFLQQKCLLLFLWYLQNLCSSISEILYWGNLACPWCNTIGLIIIGFTIWDLLSFSQGDLLQDCSEQWSCTTCHMSLVHLLSLIFGPPKLKSVPFLEHL